jgi:creatinine amidohydrolase
LLFLEEDAMRPHLLAIALLCSAGPAFAQMPDTVFLEKLTWDEVRDSIAAGKTTIIIPTGGTEQNGPHMALGKHNVRIAANAELIARRLRNAPARMESKAIRAGPRRRSAARSSRGP